ncbi:protein adenylyltransferase SelO [Thaumasiovibrio sp. DFM-14]|uniref:protein adenylyltransferase SelO n=1 Tax=Thaumasiovibrio sp. DFM-14 TaxID=3384792 RepID=UPI0039A139F4
MMVITNAYQQLDDFLCQRIDPEPVYDPQRLLWNAPLAAALNVAPQVVQQAEHYFSGNRLLPGSEPRALAYAGHQFGHYTPRLGDGRAHLLGEAITTAGKHVELQLKGSGRTAFSRQGDGRCALKPAVREYIMSEAMHALGVPTSRTLAVVSSGESIWRDREVPGAIVTRVASSHLRIGTFQYVASLGDKQALERLQKFAIQRHFPHIDPLASDSAVLFLEAVIDKQIETIIAWMRVGFIHGVMNTDNMTISGETIDYGPCAMLGRYDPRTVYSAIDTEGRYCFGNQPYIAQWNLARLAESLLSLVSENTHAAIEKMGPVIEGFTSKYHAAYYQMMKTKLGLSDDKPTLFDQNSLVDEIVQSMTANKCDYTQFFTALTDNLSTRVAGQATVDTDLLWLGKSLLSKWQGVTQSSGSKVVENMQAANPRVIPRNHHIEATLSGCDKQRNTKAVDNFLSVLLTPYKQTSNTHRYQDAPGDDDHGYKTFCGT